ncbi:MAG TPA: M1 family aminopeptidase [Gemmatimonadales bacterium]|nr:M1 family aminopeptidase [Gemmatimonadales bacterium]
MRLAFTFLALIALPVALSGQSNEARMANDRYTRSHNYHLVHQRIEVWDFNWDSTTFEGRVATTMVALRPGLDSIILDAGHELAITSITTPSGTSLRYSTLRDTLVIFPEHPVGFGDTTRFTITYHGRVDNGQGLTFITPEGRAHRPQQIWSQGEDMNNHYWFPTYDFPNDKMSWELVATVPAPYTVVSNGALVSDRPNAGGTHTVTWRQDLPTATYLVSIIVAPLARIHDAWHGVPVDYYVYHEDSALARRLFGRTPDMIDVYSHLTGLPYPWAKYAETTVADFFGGMENVSATTLIDDLPDERAYRDRPWYSWILIPHELAHQWFGDYTTTENWANFWLNEGFAEFMPGQYWRARLGPAAEDDYYLDEYTDFLRIDARRRMPLASLGSNNIYPKGALVLRMLERYLGPERFWASLHTYLTRHALGSATSDDLRQAVLEATGENLSWFWDEWVYQAGFPEFSVSAAYDSTPGTLTLTVRQTQVDTAHADSTGLTYTTPTAFRMPVTIRVGTSSGDVTQRVELTMREQTITVDHLPSAPTMVIFDDGNTILKTLTFEEPTTWLATQLERDHDLWNQSWVIKQLTARSTDSVAVAALVRAATQADYNLTRAEAAEALAAVAPERAVPALETVARDTSATVRRAAMEALGELGGERAAALARAAISSDSSYQVRAAAVGALTTADSAGRRAVIREALETPSYEEVIRTTALRAIVRSADTSFVDPVAAKLGDFRSPAFALAALANAGYGRALDSLSNHLNDARSYVRRWVVQAFQFSVRPDLAVARLEAVEPYLRYPDTRSAVAKALDRLRRGEPPE